MLELKPAGPKELGLGKQKESHALTVTGRQTHLDTWTRPDNCQTGDKDGKFQTR